MSIMAMAGAEDVSDFGGFGMSANAPAFTPSGGGGGGMGGGPPSGAPQQPSVQQGASFEQESLRAAAENLWGSSGGGLGGTGGGRQPSFTVPDLNKVPSLQAMEAESMRAAAAGLWDSGGSAGSGGGGGGGGQAASAPSAELGMPNLPSGIGAGDDDLQLGNLCGADLLAGLRLDGGSEPSL